MRDADMCFRRASLSAIPPLPMQICPTCHSPDADTRQFVFCDGCDNGYHKDCHTPPADDDCVAWFCVNCSNQPAMSPAGRFMALTFLFRVLSHSRAVAYLFPPVDRWPQAFGMPEEDVQVRCCRVPCESRVGKALCTHCMPHQACICKLPA
jgi:hypothetical protein